MDPRGKPYLKEDRTMNTGRLSTICFLLFFVGLFAAIPLIGVSPVAVIAAAVVAVVSFVYTIYLWIWGIRKGDPRLLRRGESASAEVLTAKETSWTMASGEYYGIGAPNIWKYRLEVTGAGHSPYKTKLYVCAHLREGSTVPVKVSRWNHKRVAIDGPALSEADGSSRGVRREQAVEAALAARAGR
jgi:hypothetical protein